MINLSTQRSKRIITGVACAMLAVPGMLAKTGAPHSVKAVANFTDVALSWAAPADSKELRWHDNDDYNGDTAEARDLQKSVKTFVAALFDANDLKNYVGETVEAIAAFQYRPVVGTTVLVYKDGKVVSQGKGDQSGYEKNTFMKVALDSPVVIEAGSTYMFAVCYEAGHNMDFVAIKDRSSDARGKGDLISTDGEHWTATANGEYLITACLRNDVDEAPLGYNIYRGETKLNDAPVTDTSYSLVAQAPGSAVYRVSAVYPAEELKSAPAEVSLISYETLLPSVPSVSAAVNDLDVSLSWRQPLLGGNELTWSDKSAGVSIGGTASSNTKVWVRNQFDAEDLVAFRGGKITAVNFNFAEAVISSAKIFVLKDGVIDYYEDIPAEAVSAIRAKEWTKFPLATPYALEDGHSYAYGLYVMHTAKAHPMGVDASEAVDVKGNSFSTSSPSTKGFEQTKPSWKTLKSGGIAGNWLMTADIEGSPAPIQTPVYDIYRDGRPVKAGLAATSFTESVDNLGSYKYAVVARNGDNSSLAAECPVNVKLPAAYSAPLVENHEFNPETKEFKLVWNMDKEIAHCGEAALMGGFDEEMTMMWGSQFSASELAAYKGYTITKLKFIIGAEIGDFTVGVYRKNGEALSSVTIPAGTIEAVNLYTIKLPTPVKITGDEDLILAYSGTIPAGSSAIVFDEGPAVEGGARVSLSNGTSWLNLSTINPSFAKYNVFITAMASEDVAEPSAAPRQKAVAIGRADIGTAMVRHADRTYGVEKTGAVKAASPAKAASKPVVKAFNIYCNGEKVAQVEGYQYNETVRRYAAFEYCVSTVFTNGWESAPSESVSFNNRIAQKSVAPFGLTGEVSGSDLVLGWQSPADAVTLSYVPADAQILALRMTGSGSTMTSYCASKFPASEMASAEGKEISHISFGCGNTDVNSWAVFVMFGENIVYQQSVPVSTLTVGLNDVRLNEPVIIPAGTDVAVGFVTNYKASASIAPLGCFASTENANFGDLISSSGTSWRSLQKNLKSNYCWYVKAILADSDRNVMAKSHARAAADGITYNIYRDGVLVDSTSDTKFTVKDAASGKYYVTAVTGQDESAESNAVIFTASAGVADVTADGLAIVYDRASATVSAGTDARISVYSAAGVLVASGNGAMLSIAHLPAGVYLVRAEAGSAVGSVRIVR